MKRILFDQKERCGEWAKPFVELSGSWGEWYQAIGLEQDGELIAVVVYNYASECDIAMHIAAVAGKRWMTRDFLRAVFRYPFLQLGVRRITGYVPSKNSVALAFDEHIGFRREGLMRHAMKDDDVVVMGMLKSECKYL